MMLFSVSHLKKDSLNIGFLGATIIASMIFSYSSVTGKDLSAGERESLKCLNPLVRASAHPATGGRAGTNIQGENAG